MKKDVVISPIFYMGNKRKLIKKGLIDLFPDNINTFYELFSGSCIVSMNTKANKYVVNDIDKHLYELYCLFSNSDADELINYCEEKIDEFNLPKERTKRNVYDDIGQIEKYKQAYINFRDSYNNSPNPKDLYLLSAYAFSQQFRFSKKGKFNMPFGNDCFTNKNEEYIRMGCNFFNKLNNVEIFNKSYNSVINFDNINANDFIYVDPPYFNTTSVYNENRENGGWSEIDEDSLYNYLETINNYGEGIKFAMSNVFENKGKVNHKLIDWCDKNNWHITVFDKFTYVACGKGNSNAKEVLITNYKINL